MGYLGAQFIIKETNSVLRFFGIRERDWIGWLVYFIFLSFCLAWAFFTLKNLIWKIEPMQVSAYPQASTSTFFGDVNIQDSPKTVVIQGNGNNVTTVEGTPDLTFTFRLTNSYQRGGKYYSEFVLEMRSPFGLPNRNAVRINSKTPCWFKNGGTASVNTGNEMYNQYTWQALCGSSFPLKADEDFFTHSLQ